MGELQQSHLSRWQAWGLWPSFGCPQELSKLWTVARGFPGLHWGSRSTALSGCTCLPRHPSPSWTPIPVGPLSTQACLSHTSPPRCTPFPWSLFAFTAFCCSGSTFDPQSVDSGPSSVTHCVFLGKSFDLSGPQLSSLSTGVW